jgi:hypothetical protein
VRLKVTQTECAGKMFWIVQDTTPSWFYHGPFVDEATARDFAQAKNSAAWKELLHNARASRKAIAALTAETALAA